MTAPRPAPAAAATPARWAALNRAARLPVLRCVVNRDWHHRRFAVIGLVRGGPAPDRVAAVVHVDLGCLGIRHAALRWTGEAGLDELLARAGLEPVTWIDCTPALVARIIDTGADLGWVNGATDSPRFRLVQRLFDPLEPEDGGPPVETGHPSDGQPMYIPRAGDDGPGIVRHLTRVFGPTGFTVAGHPPLPEGDSMPFDRTQPGADPEVLRAGVLARRYITWPAAWPAMDVALDETVGRARQAGLSDAVAYAAAPWHARLEGRPALDVFAERCRQLSEGDRRTARRWAEHGSLRLLRLDSVVDGEMRAWDPLGGDWRRLVSDNRRVHDAAGQQQPGMGVWVVARPLAERWYVDRMVPVEDGLSAAERALIAFESSVSSVEVAAIVEDSLDASVERVPPRTTTAPPAPEIGRT